jgi:hypothetical protein
MSQATVETKPPSTTQAQPSPPSQRPRQKRLFGCMGCTGCLTTLGILVLVLAVVAGYCYWLWSSPPGYWTQRQALKRQVSEAERTQAAENLEKRYWRMLSYTGPDEPDGDGGSIPNPGHAPNPAGNPNAATGPASQGYGLRLLIVSVDEANAWLDTKLQPWLANQSGWLKKNNLRWPPEVSEPMVAIEDGAIVLAFRYTGKDFTQIISVVGDVSVPADGKIKFQVKSIRGGDLPLPAKTMTSQMRDRVDKARRQMLDQIASTFDGKTFDAAWPHPMDDRQRVKLLGLRVRKDDVAIEIRIEP